MKDVLKCLGLFAVGLLTAIFLYPFLHELGHSVATILFGTRIEDFRLLPLPSVMCEVDITDKWNIIAVGFGGMLLSYLVSCVSPVKHFWVWYVWFVNSFICLLSIVLSIVGICLYNHGSPMQNEDVTQIMQYASEYYPIYLAILIGLFGLRLIQIIKTKPIVRCTKQFNIE